MSKIAKPTTVVVILSKDTFENGKKINKPSDFAGKVKTGRKLHTIRGNFEYWDKKIAKMKESGGVLSVRQWSAAPYRSPQEVIIEVTADKVGVQKLELTQRGQYINHTTESGESIDSLVMYEYYAQVDGLPVSLLELAKNDGLTENEFVAWFAPVFTAARAKYKDLAEISSSLTIDFAVIHFTPARYAINRE